jgi:hypothetical protein
LSKPCDLDTLMERIQAAVEAGGTEVGTEQ